MTLRRIALLVGVLALAASAWAAPPCDGFPNIFYCQAFDGTGNAYSSQNDTNSLGNFATVYDNFTLTATWDVESVHWVGEYFNPPNQGPITAWTLTFYANNAGQPGNPIASGVFPGNGNETFLGTFGGFPTYMYSLEFGSFDMGPGTYWLSVVPDLGFPPQWGWSSGIGGDGISYQDFFGTRSQLAVDMAFALDGRPVPEPGIIFMLGAGALGTLGVIRRRLF